MRRTAKIVVDIIAVLLAGATIFGIALAVRLAVGPMPVNFLKPHLIASLEPADGSLDVELDDLFLTWDSGGGTLQIRAVGLHIADADGRTRVVLPEMTVGLSARAMLSARIAPTSLEVVGLRMTLTRDRDGAVRVSEAAPVIADAPPPEAQQETGQAPVVDSSGGVDVLERVLGDLLAPPGSGSNLGYLRMVNLLDVDVTLDDKRLGVVWRAPSSTFAFLRDPAGLRLRGIFGLDLGGEMAEFSLDAEYDAAREQLDGMLRLSEVSPALFAAHVTAFEPLAGVRLPVGGTLRFIADRRGVVSQVDFDLTGGAGMIALPWESQEPGASAGGVAVRSVVLRASVTEGLTTLNVEQLTIAAGENGVIDMRVKAAGETPGIAGGPFAADAEIAMRDLPLGDIKRYWPPDAAKGGREWIMVNMSAGHVNEARFTVAGKAGAAGLDFFEPDNIAGSFSFRDVAVRYFEPLPPITGGRGTATLDGSNPNSIALTFAVTEGATNGLKIELGKVNLTGLGSDDERLSAEAVARGGVRQALEILDHPRLGYAKELGVSPRDVSGEIAARLAVKLPLLGDLSFKQVQIAASASSRGLAMPKIALGQDLSDGAFTLQLDGKGMEVKGKAKLGELPATIAWTETFNARDVRRRLKVDVVADQAGLRDVGLDLGDMVAGSVGIGATLTETAKGAKSIAVTADLASAALALDAVGWSKAAGVPGTLKADIAMSGETITAIRDFAMDAGDLQARGRADFAGGKPRTVHLTRWAHGNTDVTAEIGVRPAGGFDIAIKGKSIDAEPFFDVGGVEAADPNALPAEKPPPIDIKIAVETLRLSDKGGLSDVRGELRRDDKLWRFISLDGHPAPGKSFTLRVLPDQANRRVVVQSDDAGSVLRALDVSEDFVGGRLSIEGRYDDLQDEPPLTGTALIENFHMINAPGLAKLLSVASLTGILNILRGDGISFDRFESPFTLKDDVLVTSGTRMHGPSLGFTAEGWLSFRDDTLALRGTVVPAYTINSILGNIPLLGRLLTGGEGSGVFAATYRMTGKLEDPDVSVNPLATLAPGFLRGLFRIFEGEMPAPAPDPSQDREPAPPKAPLAE